MTSYLKTQFTRLIPRESIKTILEIGSRDARDAKALLEFYDPDVVYVFEPNPPAINLCRTTIGAEGRITLIPAAVHDQAGAIDFYPVIESNHGGRRSQNIGASSIYPASGRYGEVYIQDKITTTAIRIDDFCKCNNVDNIDLVCMDVQGAEISVLRSFGALLHRTNYIITEACVVNIYEGQCQLHEVNEFLCHRGFRLAAVDMEYWGFGNFLYIGPGIDIPVIGS